MVAFKFLIFDLKIHSLITDNSQEIMNTTNQITTFQYYLCFRLFFIIWNINQKQSLRMHDDLLFDYS
jgi:hypothetical protein